MCSSWGMATNITSVPSDPETYAIIGAAMAVHSELGCGFLEAVYKAALCVEFHHRGLVFQPEVALPILYKGERLPLHYRVDFRCGDVLVEVKALDAIGPHELAQALNYLRAAGVRRGLVLNFGARSLQCRRLVHGFVGER